jgi:hypothetical protein
MKGQKNIANANKQVECRIIRGASKETLERNTTLEALG